MYKSVERKIKQLAKENEDVSEDFLRDAAENYSINEDGEPSTARYIIRGLEEEVRLFRNLMEENN